MIIPFWREFKTKEFFQISELSQLIARTLDPMNEIYDSKEISREAFKKYVKYGWEAMIPKLVSVCSVTNQRAAAVLSNQGGYRCLECERGVATNYDYSHFDRSRFFVVMRKRIEERRVGNSLGSNMTTIKLDNYLPTSPQNT
jgi:hypothetical protein